MGDIYTRRNYTMDCARRFTGRVSADVVRWGNGAKTMCLVESVEVEAVPVVRSAEFHATRVSHNAPKPFGPTESGSHPLTEVRLRGAKLTPPRGRSMGPLRKLGTSGFRLPVVALTWPKGR